MQKEIEGVKLYNIKETAEALRVTPQTIRAYIKQGMLKTVRIGKPILISHNSITNFLDN